MKSILLASQNSKKIKQIKNIFFDYHVYSIFDLNLHYDMWEKENSYMGNALLKAITLSNYPIARDQIILSDDSGLEVPALNNEPGIYSRYYGDSLYKKLSYKEKILILLDKMKTIKNRQAYFISCGVIYFNSRNFFSSQSAIEGRILEELNDVPNSMGYNPIFYVDEAQKTIAEMTFEEELIWTHRAKVFKDLKFWIDRKIYE